MARVDHARAGLRVRCAIYTRKSSDEGLEQEFNSLDAQREACEAYIVSQRHAGWIALSDMYDDGGLSGGTMERPALKRLLEDEYLAVSAGVLRQFVVGDHVGASLDLRKVREAQHIVPFRERGLPEGTSVQIRASRLLALRRFAAPAHAARSNGFAKRCISIWPTAGFVGSVWRARWGITPPFLKNRQVAFVTAMLPRYPARFP
jgi:Resolvase, N terminal domain